MDHVGHPGPSADLVDQNRRRPITRILMALCTHEENGFYHGAHTCPSTIWFSLWLSDMRRLEKTATDFEEDASLAWGQNRNLDSFRLETMVGFALSEWVDRTFDIVFSTWGLPQSIFSDQDPKFASEFWQAIFRRANTRLGIASAYHPNADGQSEKSNHTVKITLRCRLTQRLCNLQYMWLNLDRAPKTWQRAKASLYSSSILSHDHCTPNKS